MNELSIWKKNCCNVAGHDPVALINMNTAAPVVDHWINVLADNPGAFDVELTSVFNFTERSAENLHSTMGVMLANYQAIDGGFTPEQVIMSFWAILQGFSFSEERIQRMKDKEKEDNDFEDQFLGYYEE